PGQRRRQRAPRRPAQGPLTGLRPLGRRALLARGGGQQGVDLRPELGPAGPLRLGQPGERVLVADPGQGAVLLPVGERLAGPCRLGGPQALELPGPGLPLLVQPAEGLPPQGLLLPVRQGGAATLPATRQSAGTGGVVAVPGAQVVG